MPKNLAIELSAAHFPSDKYAAEINRACPACPDDCMQQCLSMQKHPCTAAGAAGVYSIYLHRLAV